MLPSIFGRFIVSQCPILPFAFDLTGHKITARIGAVHKPHFEDAGNDVPFQLVALEQAHTGTMPLTACQASAICILVNCCVCESAPLTR